MYVSSVRLEIHRIFDGSPWRVRSLSARLPAESGVVTLLLEMKKKIYEISPRRFSLGWPGEWGYTISGVFARVVGALVDGVGGRDRQLR